MNIVTRPTFDEYVTVRSGVLLRFAYLLCGDRHLAEDLVQEVLIKAHRRWSAIEAEEPDAYLKRALVRTHVSWLRRRASSEITTTMFPDTPGTGGFDDAHASRDELWALLTKLPRAQRAVLVLRYFEDLDDRRIAELVGTSPSTVRTHAHRGLHALREVLAERADEAPASPGMLDNVRRGAARAAVRRRAVVAGGIAAIVAALAITVPMLLPERSGPPPVEPSPSISPSPAVSVSPSPAVRAVPDLPGTTVYLTVVEDALVVNRYNGGLGEGVTVASLDPRDGCSSNAPTLSPDGTSVAYVVETSDGGLGDLYVVSAQGGQARFVASGVACLGNRQPIWFPDSRSLRIGSAAGECGRVDVATGAFTALGDDWCGYVAFAPGGAFRVRRSGVVETAEGAVVRPVPEVPAVPELGPVAAQGISADGRLVALDREGSDPTVVRSVRWVVDTVTGEVLSLDTLLGPGHDDETLTGAHFLEDGGLVVSTRGASGRDSWYVLSGVGTVTDADADAPATGTISWGIATGQFHYLP